MRQRDIERLHAHTDRAYVSHASKETYTYRIANETYRPYTDGKRDLVLWQKRPSSIANETYRPYTDGKRDLRSRQTRNMDMREVVWQKRPICVSKETYDMENT